MRITMLGKRWNFRFEKDLHLSEDDSVGTKVDGYCNPPDKQDKEIVVESEQDEENLLSTIIHETDHAAFPWMDEEYVLAHGNDLAKLLIRLGYVRVPQRGET